MGSKSTHSYTPYGCGIRIQLPIYNTRRGKSCETEEPDVRSTFRRGTIPGCDDSRPLVGIDPPLLTSQPLLRSERPLDVRWTRGSLHARYSHARGSGRRKTLQPQSERGFVGRVPDFQVNLAAGRHRC